MKNLTRFLFALILLTSCRKEFASFQKSPNLSYVTQKKSSEILPEISKIEQLTLAVSTDNSFLLTNPDNKSFAKDLSVAVVKTDQIIDDGKRKQKNIGKKSHPFIEKFSHNQRKKDNKIIKKRRKPVPFNPNIYTGFVILGIAILLALVSLNSLSLLFGVAAILFLYWGFKKYFRKKRRRDIFR